MNDEYIDIGIEYTSDKVSMIRFDSPSAEQHIRAVIGAFEVRMKFCDYQIEWTSSYIDYLEEFKIKLNPKSKILKNLLKEDISSSMYIYQIERYKEIDYQSIYKYIDIHNKNKGEKQDMASKEFKNTGIYKEALIDLREKIINMTEQPETEEATKQWFIMPMLLALGYNPFSSDIIPEYTLDFGTKSGEKVDYALQINNQPVMIVECKKMGVSLSEKHVSQLFRYFSVTDVHIALLTNGDDYWFFTDSQKENIMDSEPYYKIKMSKASDDELDKLCQYSKDLIKYNDIAQVVQYERFQRECQTFIHGLKTNNIPSWFIDVMAERCEMTDIDRPELAKYLYDEVEKEFNNYKVDNTKKKDELSLGNRMKQTMEENKKNISNIKLHHEYVFNDYSDGDWTFHKIEYAVMFGQKFDGISARGLLINTIEYLFDTGILKRDEVLKEEQFNGQFKINAQGGFRGEYHIEKQDVYISTAYSMQSIIQFIERVLDYCNLPYNSILLSFSE